MASMKVRPTPPPGGPALVRRSLAQPALVQSALGALWLSLCGTACGDDGSTDTANDSQPPMIATDGPMPNPTSDSAETTPPMLPPTTGDSATGDSTTVSPMPPPMPNPTTGEADSSGTDDTGTGTGTDGSTTQVPPMPPPDGGALPGEEPA